MGASFLDVGFAVGFVGGGLIAFFAVFVAPRLVVVGLASCSEGGGEGDGEGIRASGTGPLLVNSLILAFFLFKSILNWKNQCRCIKLVGNMVDLCEEFIFIVVFCFDEFVELQL